MYCGRIDKTYNVMKLVINNPIRCLVLLKEKQEASCACPLVFMSYKMYMVIQPNVSCENTKKS